MKNVGVPETPLRSAESTSSATRAASLVRAQVVREALDVEAELVARTDQVGRRSASWCAKQQVVHLPERALRRPPPRPPRRRAARAGARRSAAGGARRSARRRGRRAARARRLGLAAVRALEVAVLDERDRRVGRARGCGRAPGRRRPERSTIASAVPEQRARPQRAPAAARSTRKTSHVSTAAHRPRVSTPSLASCSCAPWKASARDQQRHGEADAGDRAAADDRRPADRRAQPAAAQLRRRATTRPAMPTGLPTT